ncbi:MAG TPA: hypothetical protein VGE94_09495 [Chloroflexota bacterium]
MDTLEALERIAEAVLYEGYILWPYRRSARKNQQRWTFGGVYPRGFCTATQAGDAWRMQSQCLLRGAAPSVEVELRCLQLVNRRVARPRADGSLDFVDHIVADGQRILAWDEAVERRVALPGAVSVAGGDSHQVMDGGTIVRDWQTLSGMGSLSVEPVADQVWRLTATFENTSRWLGADRTVAQRHSFLSAHMVLRARDGTLVSATDPPAELAGYALENIGLWPVLVGSEGATDTMLASPIILSDYPQIAPESPGLLFDSGEIDQLLMLNTLTLTDVEKEEVRATDPRTRAILDRAESLTAEDFSALHGAIRDFRVLALERPTPTTVFISGAAVQPGSKVRLRPRHGADVFDLALDGRVATVESIEQDYDERVHLAVTLDEDPGRDLGALRLPGHRFFFSPDEVEPVG